MKNEHPLVKAMHVKTRDHVSIPIPNSGRMFELKHDEVPSAKNKKPGEPIAVELHGHIKSVHDDGRSMMEVKSVKSEEVPEDKDIPMVRLQQSPSAGGA